MIMRKKLATFAVLLLPAALFAGTVDLKVPDTVKISAGSGHVQVPGTHVFLVPPSGYSVVGGLSRLQKDTSSYLQVLDARVSYSSRKKELDRSIAAAKKQGLSAYYEKEFVLGRFPALLIYGPGKRAGQEELLLIFGDDSCTAMLTAYFPGGAEAARNDLLAALLSAVVNKDAVINEADMDNFTVDVAGTGFLFNSRLSSVSYYTINGKGDPVNGDAVDQIMVLSLPPLNDQEKRKAYALKMLEQYRQNKISIPSYELNEIAIGEKKAIEITFTGNYNGKYMYVYQVVLGDEKTTVLFCGMAYRKKEEMMKQFKAVAGTLRTR
jgi:hypothetical protein